MIITSFTAQPSGRWLGNVWTVLKLELIQKLVAAATLRLEQVPSGAQHFLEWLIENLTTVSKDFSANTSSSIHSLNR